MNVSINFPAEIETTLLRRAAATGKDIGTIVKEFVTERLAEESPPPAKAASHDEFMARLHKIIDLHPMTNGSVDDSRESIYAGRGE
jgi:plasmid stability protein